MKEILFRTGHCYSKLQERTWSIQDKEKLISNVTSKSHVSDITNIVIKFLDFLSGL